MACTNNTNQIDVETSCIGNCFDKLNIVYMYILSLSIRFRPLANIVNPCAGTRKIQKHKLLDSLKTNLNNAMKT